MTENEQDLTSISEWSQSLPTGEEPVAHPPPAQDQSLAQIPDAPAPLPPPVIPEQEPPSTVEEIRQFSESPQINASAPAAEPYTLRIEGPLLSEEKARLLDLLAREKMGFREVDLEPQFESGRILLPQISEYAAVLIVQALRSTQATMTLSPSNRYEDVTGRAPEPKRQAQQSPDLSHPAEHITLTASDHLSGLTAYAVIDVVAASATLRTPLVEAESSSEYMELLESLKRELKYRAHVKGATAVLHLKIELTPLSLPSVYRLTVSGNAVQALRQPES